MKSSKKMKKQTLTLIIVYMIICSIGRADYPQEIEIDCKDNQIKVGEPLVLKLTHKYEKPQISEDDHKICPLMSYESSIQITKDDEEVFEKEIIRGDLYLQDTKGINYSSNIIVFYDLFKNKLVFDSPGKYTIIVRATNKIMTKMDIQVQSASQSEKKAISFLSDPNDFSYLEHGSHRFKEKRPERMSHLKKVVGQSERTVLAKWCSARLGLEYIKKFQEKYPSFSSFLKFREQFQKGLVKEPLFEQAHKYLTVGTTLPDEFPIREDVLKELGVLEFTKGNSKKAMSLLDELSTKYPKGKHGRKASQMKQELLKIQKREKQKEQ